MKMSKRDLNTALRRLSKAATEVAIQRNLIDDHCETVYEADTGSVDNDEFIDACGLGGSSAAGMTADEFHRSMIQAIDIDRR